MVVFIILSAFYLLLKSWSWEEEAFKGELCPRHLRTSPNKALGCQMLPKKTQRPAFQDRLAAGHHRMNTCSNTRQARRWKAEVKTEEVDGRKDKSYCFRNMSLRRWQKGNKYLPSPYYVPGSVLGARNTVTQ